ncbi:MAG TPA: FecR domain-containing protein [Burkholderiales bacterium]|nr:FecR domain-containing protein [Burkholderiales bacterium]
MKIRVFLTALLMLSAGSAWAATRPNLMVESVQMPAWVVHDNGLRQALAVGAALGDRDKIQTGAGARVLLRLADGSTIKLGENAALTLDDLGQQKDKLKQLVTATLDVLAGAFRFTTQAIYKFHGERDVKVKLVTITAGIRGTDIWGKHTDQRDVLALLEGKVTVVHGTQAFTMDQQQSVYTVPKEGAPTPVAPLDSRLLEKWSLETEIVPGGGAISANGMWKIYLATANSQEDALALYDKLSDAGYAADVRPVKKDETIVYRLRISGLPSKAEAEILAAKLKAQKDALGIEEPTVAR